MKYYFEYINSEICYPLKYFKDKMKDEEIEKMTLYEGEKTYVLGYFWCREFMFPCEKGQDTCGKDCEFYKPKNGKSGCCKHYSNVFYEPSEKIKILKK